MDGGTDGWRKFPADMAYYEAIRDFIMDGVKEKGFSKKARMRLELGIEEAVVNIIHYAYEGRGNLWVRRAFSRENRQFTIDLADYGVPFDPLARPAPDARTPLEDREPGGYGILFMKTAFASLRYAYEPWNGAPANRLRMIFEAADD